MDANTYKTRIKRSRGMWLVSVPALPSDAPVIRTRKLGNAAPEMIVALAAYLGVHESTISVDVAHPVRPERRSLRSRVTATTVQLAGGAGALSGVYLAAGLAVTLMTAGLITVALGVLRESGRI
jgi:hypothetical protein